jgi:hypothetical protein
VCRFPTGCINIIKRGNEKQIVGTICHHNSHWKPPSLTSPYKVEKRSGKNNIEIRPPAARPHAHLYSTVLFSVELRRYRRQTDASLLPPLKNSFPFLLCLDRDRVPDCIVYQTFLTAPSSNSLEIREQKVKISKYLR